MLEPDHAYLQTGQRNAALNGVDAKFINAFAGGKSRPPESFSTESSGEVVIPCRSVPDLMAEAGWHRLDVLHCDAQGVEFDVVESCTDLLRAGAIGWVIVSTHSHHISGDPLTHQRCHSILRQLGGTIVAEHDVHESYSGDGPIVARFGPLPDGWVDPKISYNRYGSALFWDPAFDLAAISTGSGQGTAMSASRSGNQQDHSIRSGRRWCASVLPCSVRQEIGWVRTGRTGQIHD